MTRVTRNLIGGMTVGLVGGSFNPPHSGHLEITEVARHRLGLSRCIWLVTPGNPLKDPDQYAPLEDRVRWAKALTSGRPWLTVSDIERTLGTRFTVDTLTELTTRFTATRFVWIMGADGLRNFHLWSRWRTIAATVPIAVVTRPGETGPALRSKAARILASARTGPGALLDRAPPAWCLLDRVSNPQSSTAIRASRRTL